MQLYTVTLFSSFMSGPVRVGVLDQLPVVGIDLVLSHDLAGKRVFPVAPEVIDVADVCVDVPAAPIRLRFFLS